MKSKPFHEKFSKKEPKEYISFEKEKPAKPRRVVKKDNTVFEKKPIKSDDEIRLNKYVATCGIASRRAADELIKAGKIWVNGKEVKEPGIRIQQKDRVTYQGRLLKPETNLIYLLMNKPKDVITTTSDEKGRKSVMDLVQHKVTERIYPVGRLDRMTTGLLLLTNDGDLARNLSHPSSEVRKIYYVVLNKNISVGDLEKIGKGLELEDGIAEVDAVSYIDGAPHNEVGITIHSGKNRIVRRIFDHLGYDVTKLDRVAFAGLTKRDLPRGHFRALEAKEVTLLKHFGNRKKNTNSSKLKEAEKKWSAKSKRK